MVKDSVKVKYDKYLKMEEVLYQTIILSSPVRNARCSPQFDILVSPIQDCPFHPSLCHLRIAKQTW
jgi:hypothetical protein